MENKHNKKCAFELNHQGECIFPPQEPIPCCFSEVNELGKHITNCNNLPTKLDEDNVQIRYFCQTHLLEVKRIRNIMHKNCISKEKLIKFIKNFEKDYIKGTSWIFTHKLLEFIEIGKFDYE